MSGKLYGSVAALLLSSAYLQAQTIENNTTTGQTYVKGKSFFDSPTNFYILNNATSFGRTNLIITGRFQTGNDAWSFGTAARNSLVFAQNATDADNQNVGAVGTEKYSIQLEGNTNSLGFQSVANGGRPNLVLTQEGKVGVCTTTPLARFDVGLPEINTLTSVLGRLPEGDGVGTGTYLGIKTGNTNEIGAPSFTLQHAFHGILNSGINFCRGGSTLGGFMTFFTNDGTEKMRLDDEGNLMLGTQKTGGGKLAVNGTIVSTKVKVSQNWADFVFDSSYPLQPLQEVSAYIKNHKYLPGMPSASEVEKAGLDLGSMCQLQQVKIEELTLYLISEQKARTELEAKLKEQETKQQQQEAKIAALQKAVEELLKNK